MKVPAVLVKTPPYRFFNKRIAAAQGNEFLPAYELPRNVRRAAALFEALAAYGINYVIDSASSFVEFSGNASAVDSLNYPYQTLYYR
ncbi:MAG: hypothetical protein LBJ90_01185, partial [Treponema sp.]|nr:hypothetical protein [Treponema sp.]